MDWIKTKDNEKRRRREGEKRKEKEKARMGERVRKILTGLSLDD